MKTLRVILPMLSMAVLFFNVSSAFAQTTQLRSSDCNVTGVLVTTDLYANQVSGATQYRFRIDNGDQIQIITKSVRFFNIDELGQTRYNQQHLIDVAVEVDGVFGPYGTVCSVTTAAFPIQLRGSDCNREFDDLTRRLFANTTIGSEYYFEVTNTVTSEAEVITKSVRFFRLSDLSNPTYETEYLVRVACIIEGVYQPYGNTCAVFTLTDPNAPRLLEQFCGVTYEYLAYEQLEVFDVPDAEMYEIRITNGAEQFSIEQEGRTFLIVDFVDLPTLYYAYNTTYDVDVRVRVGGVWSGYGPACPITTTEYPYTEVQHLCGQTVTSFSQPISVLAIFSAPAYEFEVTDLSDASVQTLVKTTGEFGSAARRFSFNELDNYGYGKDYSIRARVEFGGDWHPYGPACTVSTPPAITKLRDADCGKSLTSMTEQVFANSLEGATAYQFEVTNTMTSEVEVVTNGVRSFALEQLASPTFNTVYSVRVRAEIDGDFGEYGAACDLTSPSLVLARLRSSDCGRQLISLTQMVYANYTDATSYSFEFTNTNTSEVEVITKSSRGVNLSELSSPATDVTYEVRISVIRDGDEYPYGPICLLHAPITSSELVIFNDIMSKMTAEEQASFVTEVERRKEKGEGLASLYNNITPYPNPAVNEFRLSSTYTLEDGEYSVLITDAMGRIVQLENVSSEDFQTTPFGSGYSSGIYLIRVTHGNDVFQTRVVVGY